MRQDCIKITCDNCGEEIVVMTYNGEPDASQAKNWNLNGLSYTGMLDYHQLELNMTSVLSVLGNGKV